MNLKLEAEQQACLTLLREGTPSTSATARLLSVSSRQLTVQCQLSAAAIGAPVKVEWPNYLVLAEVADRQEATGLLVLQIRHAFDMREVEQIRRKWM